MKEQTEPTLPVFGEAEVSYTVMKPRQEPDARGQGGDTRWETVNILVDEIDLIEDPALRRDLWLQFNARTTGESYPRALLDSRGIYTNRVFVQTLALGATFSEDGVVENEDLPAYREQKSHEREAQQQKSASWLTRLFKK